MFEVAGCSVCTALNMVESVGSTRDTGAERGFQGCGMPPIWLESNCTTKLLEHSLDFGVGREACDMGARSD